VHKNSAAQTVKVRQSQKRLNSPSSKSVPIKADQQEFFLKKLGAEKQASNKRDNKVSTHGVSFTKKHGRKLAYDKLNLYKKRASKKSANKQLAVKSHGMQTPRLRKKHTSKAVVETKTDKKRLRYMVKKVWISLRGFLTQKGIFFEKGGTFIDSYVTAWWVAGSNRLDYVFRD